MPAQGEAYPELSVVKMEENKLTIEIKPPKAKKSKPEEDEEELEDEDYEPPSSAEIEVIHKHPTPNLHSILKTRTPSESSEEVNGMEPESPRSDGEELSSSFGKKRSVSFSNHVDQASFKSFASVSSMTTVLKSKRRRQRKRDEKKQGRVRRASEGTSSSEECLHSGDAHSLSEGESSSEKPLARCGLSRALSDPGPTTCPDKADQKEKKKSGNKKGKKGNKKPESIPKETKVLDFRTSSAESGDGSVSVNICNTHEGDSSVQPVDSKAGNVEMNDVEKSVQLDKNKKIISEVKSKLAGGDVAGDTFVDRHDSDDDDFVDAVSSMSEEFNEKISIVNRNGLGEENDRKESVISNGEVVDLASEGKGTSQNKENGYSNKESSNVETMLSWEDGPRVSNPEHVTKCPFDFTNSLIYELDID